MLYHDVPDFFMVGPHILGAQCRAITLREMEVYPTSSFFVCAENIDEVEPLLFMRDECRADGINPNNQLKH